MIVNILFAAFIGAFIHRFRGGWPAKPAWIPGHARFWSAFALLAISWFVFDPWIASAIAITYLIGSTPGWHNWMNCGDPMTYRNGYNVSWIDDAVGMVMGAYWIPKDGQADPCFVANGLAVHGVNGSVRPPSWRRRAACLGMALRGLLYLPMMLVIPLRFESLSALAFAGSVLLFGPIYGLSRWVFQKTNKWINYRDDSLTIAEPLVGGIFGVAIWIQWVIVSAPR